jgi:hypothetical protein
VELRGDLVSHDTSLVADGVSARKRCCERVPAGGKWLDRCERRRSRLISYRDSRSYLVQPKSAEVSAPESFIIPSRARPFQDRGTESCKDVQALGTNSRRASIAERCDQRKCMRSRHIGSCVRTSSALDAAMPAG